MRSRDIPPPRRNRISRRTLIVGAAALSLAPAAVARPKERFAVRRGWVLRPDDLDRLALE